MCISIMLQCMHLCIYIVYAQGVDQKYFWTWNEITHHSAMQIQYSPYKTSHSQKKND